MRKEYGGIDRFRLCAAFLIVAIHTYPLASVSDTLDYGFVHVFARVAVPFFLMVSGFFLYGSAKATIKFVKKTGLLYAGATLLYLPVGIYAGHYSSGNVFATAARDIVFDGTFYHLWYLPAAILGVLLVYALSRRFSLNAILGTAAVLYVLGLLGDSYYGLVSGVPFIKSVYDAGFGIFSYTRNGLFYAPVFIAMGAAAKTRYRLTARASLVGFGVSMALMLAEGFVLRNLGDPRHDSMYIMLPLCMFFLFRLAIAREGKASAFLREGSMWIYILHPLVIIAVRGVARFAGLTGLLVENSVLHYLAVCVLSLAAAVFIIKVRERIKPVPFKTGRAWIELDMDALRHNVGVLRGVLPEGCALMPAVKANAYGHGAVAVCRELNRLGVRAFCVATLPEGVELRKRRVKGEILVLGYTHPKELYLLRRYRLTQTVIDYEYAETLNARGKGIAVHIKLDTGMRRLGEPSENTENILRIFECENLGITGVFTHFSARDDAFTELQVGRFNDILSKIRERGYTVPKIHAQSSYGVFKRPDLSCDYARVGLALYGAYEGAGLRPVLSLKARIGVIKAVCAGEAVGYGAAFDAPADMKIAVISIGYADGVPRSLSRGAGHVLINGLPAPVVGNVCMDMLTVDVTHIEGAEQGGVAVIIGRDGEREITAVGLAEQAGTIPNEILSRLGGRLERLYGL
jgi:serine/alanine racemase